MKGKSIISIAALGATGLSIAAFSAGPGTTKNLTGPTLGKKINSKSENTLVW